MVKPNSSIHLDPEQESEVAAQAYIEYKQTGQTTQKCPRCSGNLLVYDGGTGYKVWCEKEQCLVVTFRGI